MAFNIREGFTIIRHNNDVAICTNGIDTLLCNHDGDSVLIPAYCAPFIANTLCDSIFTKVYDDNMQEQRNNKDI